MADEQNQSILVPVDIEAEMRKSYLDYAMSVIIGRALPDVRDGLKPVHRRILFGMYELGLTSTKPYRKCAKIVGEVLGKYHPHGDAPVYDALVRMAQDFNMRYPLVDGQGNFGSVDGDMPAAMRYTEARLAKIAEELLADIEKETVDFLPNFDETEKEPTVLPTRVPNLLVNGASGIAVGMATNIPPHNLREVIDATIAMVEKPELTLKEAMKFIPGPDFPTGGYIAGREGIEQAYKTGRGSFTMRAKAAIEEAGKDRENIVITEIPYQVNKAKLIERIAELVTNKKLEGIADVRDESDRDGMRIVIELKRGEESQLILNNLFKHTQMQESFGMILLAIVGGQPREMGLLEEAIGEFQKVAKANDRGKAFRYAMQCCTLLGLAFMEKSQPNIAAIWYERALNTQGVDAESKLALRYDLGVAQESAGDLEAALKSFSQVYAVNIDYRDVAERIASLQKPAR